MIISPISMGTRGAWGPVSHSADFAPTSLALGSRGVIRLGFVPVDVPDKLADPRARFSEPFDLSYYRWRYGKAIADKEQLREIELDKVALAEAEKRREITEQEQEVATLQAYVRELSAGLETGLAAELAGKEKTEALQAKIITRLEQNLVDAREALLLAMDALRRQNNEKAALLAVMDFYF